VEHPNVSVVRRLYQAFISRSESMLWDLAGEDMLFHMPGKSRFAGTHRGREQVLALFQATGAASGNSIRISLHDVVGNAEHVVGLHRMTGTRDGRTIDQSACIVCHVKEGVLLEVWLWPENVRRFDEFFA
jgi:ketosteroid isomerase-like protein